jgi:squalene synthase HpnC
MSTAIARSGPAAETPPQHAVMAQLRDENFPVASRFLGRGVRRQLIAIYGFARLVDDIGDEAAGDRLALLDRIEAELDAVYGASPAHRAAEHPVMRSLAAALRVRPLPDAPFRRLLDANRQDQRVSRYETFDELLGYCRLSAAPVGELVLHVFGAATPERIALSDQVCAGLQVTEHLQDIREDYGRGRIYIPREDLVRFSCEERELGEASACQPLRELVAFEVARARSLLDAGAPLAPSLNLRLRLAVAGFVAGGRSALAGIERASHDTLRARPARPRSAFAAGWAAAVRGR